MKHLNWLLILPLLTLIVACGSDDEDEDPNDDSIWSVQPSGIKSPETGYTETFARISDGNYSFSDEGVSATCTAFDADGDGVSDDGSIQILEFTDSTVTARLAVFLNNSTCNQVAYFDYDYADEVVAEYTISSSSLDFNRIDMTVTALERHVGKASGASALNAYDSDAGACGKTDWAAEQTVSFADISCATTGTDMNAMHNPLDGDIPAVSDILEGVYTFVGGYISIAVDVAGSRPGESSVATVTSDGMNGGPIYAR